MKKTRQFQKKQDNLEEAVKGIQIFLEKLPMKRELLQHSKAMEETLEKIQEVSTGLTVQMEMQKISESTSHRPKSVQGGPSYTHPDRRARMNQDESDSYYTQDTREEARERYGYIRGGNGDDSGDEDEDPDVPLGPPQPPGPPQRSPQPPGPPPPPYGTHQRRRRKPEVKPIKLKDPYPFEGKAGDDFEARWIMVQIFIHDQPEKFDETGRTINWVGGLLNKYAAARHVQWERQALPGKFPRSWTTYLNDIALRFEDKEAQDGFFRI